MVARPSSPAIAPLPRPTAKTMNSSGTMKPNSSTFRNPAAEVMFSRSEAPNSAIRPSG